MTNHQIQKTLLHATRLITLALVLFFTSTVISEERIELETTIIKGNKELPKILFIVPWQDVKQSKVDEQPLVIHSLYGDLFDPVVPLVQSPAP